MVKAGVPGVGNRWWFRRAVMIAGAVLSVAEAGTRGQLWPGWNQISCVSSLEWPGA